MCEKIKAYIASFWNLQPRPVAHCALPHIHIALAICAPHQWLWRMPEDLSLHTNISTFGRGEWGRRRRITSVTFQQEIPPARIHGWATCACVGVSCSLFLPTMFLSRILFSKMTLALNTWGSASVITAYQLISKASICFCILFLSPACFAYSFFDSTCSLERAASVLHAPTGGMKTRICRVFPPQTQQVESSGLFVLHMTPNSNIYSHIDQLKPKQSHKLLGLSFC